MSLTLEIGLDDERFDAILTTVGAQLKLMNTDIDDVEKATVRVTKEVNRMKIYSRAEVRRIARNIRKTGQMMIFMAQVTGSAFDSMFATAVEVVALSVEIYSTLAAAEAMSPALAFKTVGRLALIYQLIALQSKIEAGKLDAEIDSARARAGLFRVLSFR